ncbi:MAG TPA: glycogen/starch synthase, partial [Polyangiales bacterium]|nr:glycogen/starch synthase [Polyangiales bacterium]
MEILLVAAELAPYARLTPAADSIASLSKALRQLGHSVTVALPRGAGFQGSGPLMARRLSPLVVEPGLEVTVLEGQLPSGVAIVLFDSPELGKPITFLDAGRESDAEGQRVALLCRAAQALVRERAQQNKPIDVVHAHDWPAAPVATLQREISGQPVLLTLHGCMEEQWFEAASMSRLGPCVEDPGARHWDRVSPLRLGLLAAHSVTTVSSGYAQALSQGVLSTTLSTREEPVIAVVEGVDYSTFNPATDAALESRFDAEDSSNKGRCKTALVRALELRLDPDRPLVVALLHDATANEREQWLAALKRLLTLDVAIAVVGAADEALTAALTALRVEYPGDLGLKLSAEEGDLRRAVSAADFALTLRAHAPSAGLELLAQ